MENQPKRIRKARRQGLAKKKDLATPDPRQQVRGVQPPRAAIVAGSAPNRRRATLTERKTERADRATLRRAAGRRVR